MAVFTSYTGNGDTTLTSALLAGANSGITIVPNSVALHASGTGAVNYYDGSIAPLGIGAGLLLTSGYAPGLVNDVGWDGQDNSGTTGFNNGDADIDAVVNTVFQTQSYDATALEFDFQVSDASATSISFDLVFGSEEFPEWVDQFVDCAVVMVNGVNYALFNHDPLHPLSVVSSNLAAGYFQDNANGALPIQYDGVSHVLKIVAPIQGGGALNHIKIGIADTGDHIYDSGIFIANLSAGTIPGSGVVSSSGACTSGDDSVTGSLKDEYFDLQAGNDTAYAGAGDDIVVAGAGNDLVYGGSGADNLEGDAGDDWLDGGADLDTAVYAGLLADYSVAFDGVNTSVVSAGDGLDTLVNVEQLQFKDGLYTLNAGVLTPVGSSTPPAPNVPGAVVISGIAMAGKTLSAIVVDADGLPSSSAAISYQWFSSSNGVDWSATSVTAASFTLSAADVGQQLMVSASYTDAGGALELPVSAAVTVAQASTGISINPMLIDAPLGATVMDPLTTLIKHAVDLGYTPNEASLAVKQVLGVAADINLASYDAYAVLAQTPGDAAALAFMKIAVQVAMTASVSDPSGLNLSLAVLNAYAAGASMDLTSAADLMAAGVDTASLSIVQGLNKDMADAVDFARIQKVWNDWAGQKDNLKPFLNHLEAISVHINQAPTGVASAELQTAQDSALGIAATELLAGFSDPEGGALQATGLTLDQGGSISQNADGSWTFTPDAGFSGPVELSYWVQDAQGAVVLASLMLVVAPAATPPAPVDHAASGSLSVVGTAAEGGSLLAQLTNVIDPDGLITSTAYQWQEYLNGVWTELAGAGSATLAIPADQSYVGKLVRVIATSTDALGGTTSFEGTGQTIANVNDVHTGAVSISGTPQLGQTLTASHTLADADGLGTVQYQWMADGLALAGATASTLTLSASQVGKVIAVTAHYIDGYGTLEAEISAATAPVAAADLTLQGTTAGDVLAGGAGNDSLSGLAGADKLFGLAGNDVLDGGAGVDLLDGGEGSDLYLVQLANDHGKAEFKDSGTQGLDEVRFAATSASTLTLYSGDNGIERVVIGTGSAAVANSTGSTALNVNASAAATAVTLIGNAGSNTLTGGSQGDTLDGGAGADKLLGGGGNDVLLGGGGKDVLAGGTGADRFVFNTAANALSNLDTITDFVHLSDKLQFSATVFDALGPTNWTVDQFWSAAGASSAHDASDRLIYNSSSGALYYDADGNGAVAAVQVALLGTGKTHPGLDWTDIQVIA